MIATLYTDCLEQACSELYQSRPATLHSCDSSLAIRPATEAEWLAYRVSVVHNGYKRAYIVANAIRCYVLEKGKIQ